MINRQQKVLSSSFVIILLLAGRIMFIIHMISDALELKRKALFLSQREALEREKEGAQGTMEIVKWRSEVFSFLPSSSTRSFSVTLYVVLRGQSPHWIAFAMWFKHLTFYFIIIFLPASNVWNRKY